jgi:hypothetical protein
MPAVGDLVADGFGDGVGVNDLSIAVAGLEPGADDACCVLAWPPGSSSEAIVALGVVAGLKIALALLLVRRPELRVMLTETVRAHRERDVPANSTVTCFTRRRCCSFRPYVCSRLGVLGSFGCRNV